MSAGHARVGVFVDGQAGGGVRLEDVADAFLHPALAHQFLNLAGYVDHLGPAAWCARSRCGSCSPPDESRLPGWGYQAGWSGGLPGLLHLPGQAHGILHQAFQERVFPAEGAPVRVGQVGRRRPGGPGILLPSCRGAGNRPWSGGAGPSRPGSRAGRGPGWLHPAPRRCGPASADPTTPGDCPRPP